MGARWEEGGGRRRGEIRMNHGAFPHRQMFPFVTAHLHHEHHDWNHEVTAYSHRLILVCMGLVCVAKLLREREEREGKYLNME